VLPAKKIRNEKSLMRAIQRQQATRRASQELVEDSQSDGDMPRSTVPQQFQLSQQPYSSQRYQQPPQRTLERLDEGDEDEPQQQRQRQQLRARGSESSMSPQQQQQQRQREQQQQQQEQQQQQQQPRRQETRRRQAVDDDDEVLVTEDEEQPRRTRVQPHSQPDEFEDWWQSNAKV
jgi:hypothetical protein